MNQKIKKIALKAYNNIGGGRPEDLSLFMSKYSEELANLIIFECSKAVQDGTKEGDYFSMKIEEFFSDNNDGLLFFKEEKN